MESETFKITKLLSLHLIQFYLGPSAWPQKFETCGGQKQSPVEIIPTAANKTEFSPLVWTDYLEPSRSFTLLNNWQGGKKCC